MTNSKLPYEIITDYLLEKIRTGQVNEKLPSVRELRNQFGFATVTINKVYQSLIAQGLIETHSGKGAFIKANQGEVVAESALAGFDESVIVVYKDYFSFTIWSVVHELERLCLLQGYNLINYKVTRADYLEKLVDFVKKQKNIKGILIKGMEDLFYGHIDMLNSLGIPVVLLDSGVEHVKKFDHVFSVTPDFEKSGYAMAQTLLDHGHTKLCYVQTDTHQFFSIHADQQKGIRRALREAGLPVRSLKVFSDKDRETDAMASGYQLIKENAAELSSVTGLIFSNSASAFSALKALAELGVKVPEDLSVIGEGEYAFTSYAVPAISTSTFCYEKMAESGLALFKQRKRKKIQMLEPVIHATESIRKI